MDADVINGFERVLLPILTLMGGWFGHLIRTKQKKESDVLDNVKQILTLQKQYIEEQASTIKEAKDITKRLERKLDRRDKAIRKANGCKYTNEGTGCPVLAYVDLYEEEQCDTCPLTNKRERHDQSQD